MRGAQLLARVAAAVLAAQPFPVHQVGAGELGSGPALPQVLDGLLIKGLGGVVAGEQGPGSGEQPERLRGAGRQRPLGEPTEPQARVREYVSGLVAGLERKNGWTLAERAGDAAPEGMHRLLRRPDWDVDGPRRHPGLCD